MRTPDEILRANRIELRDTRAARSYAICPECSHKRKQSHRRLKCLAVKIDDKGVQWFCNHCGEGGGEYFEASADSPRRASPAVLQNIKAKNKLHDYFRATYRNRS